MYLVEVTDGVETTIPYVDEDLDFIKEYCRNFEVRDNEVIKIYEMLYRGPQTHTRGNMKYHNLIKVPHE